MEDAPAFGARIVADLTGRTLRSDAPNGASFLHPVC